MCGRQAPDLSGRLLVVILLTIPIAGCVDDGQPPSEAADPADPAIVAFFDRLAADTSVRFETDRGEIDLLVYESLMPVTTARFLDLVRGGFYDGTIIHRVVDDFVIQGGDPSGTGQLGSGQTIPFEAHRDLPFVHGSMGLARDVDPDSGDSQWFIAEKPQPHLTDPSGTTGTVFGTYAMYAQVYAGIDVVQAIAGVTTIPGADRPVMDVRLQRATAGPPPEINLLHHPQTLATVAGSAFTIDIVHPLHAFTGALFPLTVFLEPTTDGTTPPASLSVAISNGQRTFDMTIDPTSRDPAVFMGAYALPSAGTWNVTVHVGNDDATDTVTVHPWHPDYGRYDRRPASGSGPAANDQTPQALIAPTPVPHA